MESELDKNVGTLSETGAVQKKIQAEISNKAAEVVDRVSEIGRKTVEKVNAQREPAANILDHAAYGLVDKAGKAAGVAYRTADRVQATADYVRDHDLGDMTGDVGSFVRRYPGRSLAIAAITGFLVATALRRNG